MSDPKNDFAQPEIHSVSAEPDADEASSPGPNLVLLYSLIALALATAIGLAVLIVMPFYYRR
jgi:hypothetical protein